MVESVVKGMGGEWGGHEEAFPLASLPLSLSSPMSKADGATAVYVCVCVCIYALRHLHAQIDATHPT